MTKPEGSKKEVGEPARKQSDTGSEYKEDPDHPDGPKTARDLLKDFAPLDSESDDEKDDKSTDDDYEPVRKKSKESGSKEANSKETTKRSYIPKYKKEWENKPELKAWLSESIHGNTYFYCKFCKKDYRCGISDINKHMSSKKHMLQAATPAFKAKKFKFRGLLCPAFTPFQPGKKVIPEINFKGIHKYANFLNACGVKGVLINDIMGEGMSLTIKERMEVTEIWARECEKNNQFLMVQIGGAPLKDIVELARHAEKTHVGAVVLLPDLYNKPKNHLDLIKYIKIISEFTQDIPLIFHHNPKATGVEFDVSSFLLDITGEIDSFVGLIYSTNDIQQSTLAMSVNREKFTVFMGTDEAILGAAASGFTCIMGTSLNFLPKLAESIFDSIKSGDIKDAQSSQNLLTRAIDMISRLGDPVAALKAATYIITNTCGTTTREPLQTLWEGTIKKMQAKLHEIGIV